MIILSITYHSRLRFHLPIDVRDDKLVSAREHIEHVTRCDWHARDGYEIDYKDEEKDGPAVKNEKRVEGRRAVAASARTGRPYTEIVSFIGAAESNL